MPRAYILRHVPGQHLTFKDREQIAMAYNRNLQLPAYRRLSLRKLAIQIGLPCSTLHREIRRGRVPRPILRHDKEYMEYSEHVAQDHVQAGAQNKGRGMRFTNVLAALLAIRIKDERKSPAHARKELVAEGMSFVPAVSTIYARVDHGDIGILHGETPYHPKRRAKRRGKKIRTCAPAQGRIRMPMTAPVNNVASVPATMAFRPREAIARLCSGHSAVRVPARMPMLLKLAKPQRA